MAAQRIDGVTEQQAAAGLARVREKLDAAAARSGRPASAVRIVAATKYVDAAGCAALIGAGVTDLAESRLDSLVAKRDAGVGDGADITWHFIGRLQSRQARDIAARASMIHTLCSDSAAAKLAALELPVPELLVQVNVADDPAKDGLEPDAVEAFLLALPESLEVRGFMAMPAFADDAEASRPAFAALRELRDTLAPRLTGRHRLDHLSIGTSQDWEVAVEEGATHVRLGRILYAHGE